MRPASYALSFLIPATCTIGLLAGGPWLLLAPAFTFVLTPIVDALLAHDVENVVPGEARGRRHAYDVWLWLYLPVALGTVALGIARALDPSWTLWAKLGAALSVGIVTGGGGITVAHELMHRSDKPARAGAELLMCLVTYPQFVVEHVLGHHKNVATPIDPASARSGESLYAFLPRTLIGSTKSAWHLEGQRMQRSGRRAWSLHDRRVRLLVIVAAYYLVVATVAGTVGVAFVLLQSVVAVVLLETVNYVEHYGLTRRLLDDGRYERVRDEHSWNSPHKLTGFYLFSLPRHADHHANASRPFWALRHVEDAPSLPAGYPTMVLFALVPPLWRRVMDPRVEAWRAHLGRTASRAPERAAA